MKHLSLPGWNALFLAATCALSLSASAEVAPNAPERISAAENAAISVASRSLTVPLNRPVRRLPDAINRKESASGSKITFGTASGRVKAREPRNDGFQEGFEAWDGKTANWIPEGWSIISDSTDELPESSKWGTDNPAAYYGYYPAAPEGNFAVMISFDYEGKPQDETLVSPDIEVKDNFTLSFQLYSLPFFFFDDSNFDYDTNSFEGDREVKGDLIVEVAVDGGEMKEVWSMMENFMDTPVNDLYKGAFRKFSVNLDEYAGKTIRIGFRYKGQDTDTVILDDIRVNLPQLEDVGYSFPPSTLYWGFDRSTGWGALNMPVAQEVVLSPITWTNTSSDGVTFSWEYMDPHNPGEWISSEPQRDLTVTYFPDLTSERAARNNIYYPPVLKAAAPGASDATYQAGVQYFQAGGKPEVIFTTEGSEEPDSLIMTLFPFDHQTDGYTFLTVMDDKIGDMALPIFGYNINVDKYWTDYTLNGEEPGPNDYSHLISILNLIQPATAPMVVTGSTVYAAGQVPESPDIEFKLEIIPLSPEGVIDPETNPAIATATVTADRIIRTDHGINQLLTIPFDFDTPCVLKDEGFNYVVRFSGFHNPAINYFVPLQSAIPFANERLVGWYERETNITGLRSGNSFSPMAYIEGEDGPCFNAFGIGLDAFYPYLTADTETILVPTDGTVAEYRLGSYYPGHEYTVKAPAGVTAKVEGRYGDCILSVSHDDTEVIAQGELTLSAPGILKVFKVEETSGLGEISDTWREAGEYFTIDGRRVHHLPANGLYIIRYSDGSSAKIIL